MARAPYNVLFLCEGSSARSIFGECLVRKHGGEGFRAYSAGHKPRGAVHPLTLRVLEEQGHEVRELRSKDVAELMAPEAPVMDFVFTVCSNAGCPIWPGAPVTAQWTIDDPASCEGSDAQKLWAFRRAYAELESRIRALVSVRLDSLDALRLRKHVTESGAVQPSSGIDRSS